MTCRWYCQKGASTVLQPEVNTRHEKFTASQGAAHAGTSFQAEFLGTAAIPSAPFGERSAFQLLLGRLGAPSAACVSIGFPLLVAV